MREVLIGILVIALMFICSGGVVQAQIPVTDGIAISQDAEQFTQELQHWRLELNRLQSIINATRDVKDEIHKWEDIDHQDAEPYAYERWTHLYDEQFDDVVNAVNNYREHGGGLFGRMDAMGPDDVIENLRSKYPSYHGDWMTTEQFTPEEMAERGESWAYHMTKKQMLLTKIQLMHAAQVGAEIRSSISKGASQVKEVMFENEKAKGALQTAKVGNQLMAQVARSVDNLNVQMNEFLQAFVAKELEDNQRRGYETNRADITMRDFDQPK